MLMAEKGLLASLLHEGLQVAFFMPYSRTLPCSYTLAFKDGLMAD